jgi:hypothetical protein
MHATVDKICAMYAPLAKAKGIKIIFGCENEMLNEGYYGT